MKSHKSLLSLAALIFISCENQLELDPKQNEDASITLNTESGITNILTGTYAIAATGDVYGGRILVAADLLGQTTGWRGTFAGLRQFYNKTILVDNAFSQAIYTRNYEIINAANTVINISKVTDPEKKNDGSRATFKVACLF
jgi:hypothetical protein